MEIKVNINGATNGAPDVIGHDGTFRNYRGLCKGCFAKPLDIHHAFEVELMDVFAAIEFFGQFNWGVLWFESISTILLIYSFQ